MDHAGAACAGAASTGAASPGDAYVGVGGNLPFAGRIGPVLFESAITAANQFNITVLSSSPVWRSTAWPAPPPGQTRPDFFNAVWRIAWPGDDPCGLLDALNALETRFGRVRGAANADRTLDLDILDFRGLILATSRVTLPHPRMRERRFVLGPLADLAPDWRCPATGLSAAMLLARLGAGADAQRLD